MIHKGILRMNLNRPAIWPNTKRLGGLLRSTWLTVRCAKTCVGVDLGPWEAVARCLMCCGGGGQGAVVSGGGS